MSKNPIFSFFKALILQNLSHKMGLGCDIVLVSLHKDYCSYTELRSSTKHSLSESESVTEMNTFLVNLDEEKNALPSTFLFLAREMIQSKGKTKK